MRIVASLLVLCLVCCTKSANSHAEPGPAVLAARVTHEQRTLRPDGVTITTSYQERLVRRGSLVWVERVLPVEAARHASEPSASRRHEHDWSAAPRLIEQLSDGGVALQLVLNDTRELVAVEPPEWDSVGFDSSWEEASQLASSTLRAGLQSSTRGDAPAGAHWLERTSDKDFLRVAWNDSLNLAVRVEAGTLDQRSTQSLVVEVEPPPDLLPWDSVSHFTARDVNDYRD